MKPKLRSLACILCAISAVALIATPEAQSFCGTYLSDANEPLYNDATQVVLMREGTTTVLSMANTYEGPVKDFAMVVPVPVVLQQDQVKTLDASVFRKLDKQTAPRLVAYDELDPCQNNIYREGCRYSNEYNNSYDKVDMSSWAQDQAPSPVVVEAQFTVGEYDIVVLSATESTGLQSWLSQNRYKVPAEAGPVLDSYIQQGMYFFVAKINASKVKYDQGRALLSPLRFHYTSPDFSLPVRLGMVNSKGAQDLIVNIIAKERYEAANYPNAVIPTNINVKESVRQGYKDFYEGLFAKTLEENPGAVVTEYAWGSNGCDPCPDEFIDASDYASLGGDVIDGADAFQSGYFSTIVTRLHARYSKEQLKADLIFKKVGGLQGGRGTFGNEQQPTQVTTDGQSAFQGRYIIHNRWKGAINCEKPVRYRWDAYASTQPAPSIALGGVALPLGPKPAFDLNNYTDQVPPTETVYVEQFGCGDPNADNYDPKYDPNSSKHDPNAPLPVDPGRPTGEPNTPNPVAEESSNSSSGCGQAQGSGSGSGAALLALLGVGLMGRRLKRRASRAR